MDYQEDIQIRLMRMIRDQLPDHVSLVDEIADLLDLSNDSAYRRIRGEKQLSLHEVQKLAGSFNISLDDLVGNPPNSVTFRTNFLEEEAYSFRDWLGNLLKFTQTANQTADGEAIFILNELNIYQIIQVPEVCAFKLFFWLKSNLDFPAYRDARFSLQQMDGELIPLCEEITRNYVRIRTIEFTTEETLSSFLKQVLYYYDAGFFETKEDARILCNKLKELVDHMQEQASLGYKFPYGKTQVGEEGNFQLYHNDIVLADNTILVSSGDFRSTFLTSNAINLMQSHDREFFEYNYQWGKSLLAKSTPISGTAERERNRFFRILHEQIDKVAASI